jgi:succinate dehydrogenase / fumarate reductase membrane anchor subunit
MASEAQTVELVDVPQGFEITAWKWMRYSGLLLIPLAWFHILIQDVLVGVHRIDLNYVQLRWASLAWRTYDFALLAFAFAHGVNGLRQVLFDYVRTERNRRLLAWVLLAFWFVITLIGAIAIIAGVRSP